MPVVQEHQGNGNIDIIKPVNLRLFLFLCMPGTQFQLLSTISNSNKKLQYIFHAESFMKIIIYPLNVIPEFQASAGEICLYAKVFKWWLAFETCALQENHVELIHQALKWYAEEMHFPQMQPQAPDPRKSQLFL